MVGIFETAAQQRHAPDAPSRCLSWMLNGGAGDVGGWASSPYKFKDTPIGTGMRSGDQFNLRKSQVDFQRNVIRVPNSKTGKDYFVPMNEDVRRVMLEFAHENPGSEYLFVNPDTGRPHCQLKKGCAEAWRLAGVTDLRWHDLRHAFGTRLAEAGCSEATIAELMGHTDPKTTRRYTHGTERAKREAGEGVRVRPQAPCHNPP